MYGSLNDYFAGNKISLAAIAEFFDHYGVTVHKLRADQEPAVNTCIAGEIGSIVPVQKNIQGLRCWTREHAVASAFEKLRGIFCGTGATNVMVYDNQEIVEHMIGERPAFQAKLTLYFFRVASEDLRIREHRIS